MPPKRNGRKAHMKRLNENRAAAAAAQPGPSHEPDSEYEPEPEQDDGAHGGGGGSVEEEEQMEILDEEREGGAAERRQLEAVSEPGLAAERQDGAARVRKHQRWRSRPRRPCSDFIYFALVFGYP